MAKKNKYQLDVNAPEQDELPKSRSQKKRDSQALKDIGVELYKLSIGQRKKIPLNQDLELAFAEMDRLKDKEAKRRHMQYIGKLLRQCDPMPILEALENLRQG